MDYTPRDKRHFDTTFAITASLNIGYFQQLDMAVVKNNVVKI
jgi:hypothetical protein